MVLVDVNLYVFAVKTCLPRASVLEFSGINVVRQSQFRFLCVSFESV